MTERAKYLDDTLERAIAMYREMRSTGDRLEDVRVAFSHPDPDSPSSPDPNVKRYLWALRHYNTERLAEYIQILDTPYPLQALRRLIEIVVAEELEGGPNAGCLVADASLRFKGEYSEVTDITVMHMSLWADFVEAAIRRGQREGRIDRQIHPENTAMSMIVIIQGIRAIAKSVGSDERAAWIRSAATLYLTVLLPDTDTPLSHPDLRP